MGADWRGRGGGQGCGWEGAPRGGNPARLAARGGAGRRGGGLSGDWPGRRRRRARRALQISAGAREGSGRTLGSGLRPDGSRSK